MGQVILCQLCHRLGLIQFFFYFRPSRLALWRRVRPRYGRSLSHRFPGQMKGGRGHFVPAAYLTMAFAGRSAVPTALAPLSRARFPEP